MKFLAFKKYSVGFYWASIAPGTSSNIQSLEFKITPSEGFERILTYKSEVDCIWVIIAVELKVHNDCFW